MKQKVDPKSKSIVIPQTKSIDRERILCSEAGKSVHRREGCLIDRSQSLGRDLTKQIDPMFYGVYLWARLETRNQRAKADFRAWSESVQGAYSLQMGRFSASWCLEPNLYSFIVDQPILHVIREHDRCSVWRWAVHNQIGISTDNRSKYLSVKRNVFFYTTDTLRFRLFDGRSTTTLSACTVVGEMEFWDFPWTQIGPQEMQFCRFGKVMTIVDPLFCGHSRVETGEFDHFCRLFTMDQPNLIIIENKLSSEIANLWRKRLWKAVLTNFQNTS